MNEQARRAAARLLRDSWAARATIADLPKPWRPRDRREGYAVQAELSAAPVYGWKIAASSLAGQRHINVSGPLAGRIFADKVRPEGANLAISVMGMRVAEVEFAFRFARTLTPRGAAYERAEVLDAVASLHPALEIPDSRYVDYTKVGAAQLIADCACADQFVLGAAAPEGWRGLDLAAHEALATCGGVEDRGIGANVLGDPRIALTWLVNELSEIGVALEAGQVVTTGVCTTPIPVRDGGLVHADFGVLGRVAAGFCWEG